MTQTSSEFVAMLRESVNRMEIDRPMTAATYRDAADRLETADKRIGELEVENAGCASLLQACFDATGRDVTNGGAEVLPAVIAELHDRCDAMRQARDILDVATDEEVLAFIRRVLSCRAGH